MMQILIRADASFSIGSGHVMRCRTLARELQRRGATITFLCRRQPGDLIDLLQQDFQVLALPELSLVSHEGLQGRSIYRAWLGCSQNQDAADCLKALVKANIRSADWLVVDHYGLDAQWEAQVVDGLAMSKLLVIDDLADRLHVADLLIDQNFFGAASEDRYQSLVAGSCTQLLGPQYALLSPEYALLHKLVPARTEIKRVLVFFGGVDPDNLTGRALEALQATELSELTVDVVIGWQSPHREAVERQAARRPNTRLHGPQTSLAGLIARADLAIGAGGATTLERACLGLPSLVVTIADNQLPCIQALDDCGNVQLLGTSKEVGADKIRQALILTLQEPWPRSTGQDLCDGWGIGRVAISLMGCQLPIQLRPATANDEALLLRWANETQMHTEGCSTRQISVDNEVILGQNIWTNINHLQLIVSDASGCPIGQIRFCRHPLGSTIEPCEHHIDLSLDRCARRLLLADEVVDLAIQTMTKRWGGLACI
jgi:UDP-2,4-diacetamido-2,4,6-trideoxy-beta-L-altropyranose hydrolase